MKKSTFRSNKKYFHVTLEYYTSPLLKDLDWVFLQKNIAVVVNQYEVEIQSLVMMSTHLHLLISTFEKNENYFCEKLQTKIYKSIVSDNHCEPILNYSQYLNTYKYIYRNPVEAGICAKVQDYNYSSLYYLLGKGILHCQIYDHLDLIQNPMRVLKWLNQDVNFESYYDKSSLTSKSLLV